MNLATILGAACADPFLRRELFKDPVTAARTYGFYVHDGDLDIMKAIFADEKETNKCFLAVQPCFCSHPPCPPPTVGCLEVLGAVLLGKGLLDELFADPITFVNKCGFTLSYQDRYAITYLVRGEAGPKLKEALEDLGQKIRPSLTLKAKKAA